MPDNTYPPYSGNSGAMVVPRQLTRWIDVNPQGGNLRRCETTITLPVFSISNSWNGWSDIVATFNFEATNNFSLRLLHDAPLAPNYVLCISYHIGSTVTRYMLWEANGHTLNYPLYNGEPIKKNFRLEVWNTSQGASSETSTFSFITSVKQNIDYRFGSDTGLATASGVITDFESNTSVIVTYPRIGLLDAWTAYSAYIIGNPVAYWNIIDGYDAPPGFTTVLGVVTYQTGTFNGLRLSGASSMLCTPYFDRGSVVYQATTLAVLFTVPTSASGTIFTARTDTFSHQSDLYYNNTSGTLKLNGVTILSGVVPGRIYAFASCSSNGTYVIRDYTNSTVSTGSTADDIGEGVYLGCYDTADANVLVHGVTMYYGDKSSVELQDIISAMISQHTRPLNMNLPLTFPATAVSTTN